MPIFTDFDAATSAAISACDARIEDAIGYQLAGGAFATIKGTVDYGDALRDVEGVRVIDNAITVTVSKAQLPAKPTDRDRVTLPLTPGVTFKPVNAITIRSGTDWQFEVKRA